MIGVAAGIGLAIGCRQQDMREMHVVLSGVGGAADLAVVSNAVAALDGVVDGSIVFDGMDRLTLRYDSMKLARKNIEYAVADTGFSANDIPPKEERMRGSGVRP